MRIIHRAHQKRKANCHPKPVIGHQSLILLFSPNFYLFLLTFLANAELSR